MNKSSVIRNKIVPHEALTFDDILLLPGFADFKRSEVSLKCDLHAKLLLPLPVISSPMDTVTEVKMAEAIAQAGGLGVIHRNISVSRQAEMVAEIKTIAGTEISAKDDKGKLLVAAAAGPGKDLEERIDALIRAGADCIVVDSAHGYTSFIIEAVKKVKEKAPGVPVMAGNVATFDGAKGLISAGADILRVGMGPGSICTTRIITGMGVPQISAVAACVRATEGTKVTVVADGGIRQVGDIAKALAFGANAVMLGSLLARYDEAPGEVTEANGKKVKFYRGMGSVAAMKKGGAERYGQKRDTDEKKLIAEGVEAFVEYKGSVSDFLFQIDGSLRSSFYYIGARNLAEFFEKTRVIKISNAGLLESHPHDVAITSPGENYQL